MNSDERMATRILLDRSRHAPARTFSPEAFAPHAGTALAAAALVLLTGTAIDLGVLWLGQRAPNPHWEFVAIASTLEAYPRLALGVAALAVALYLRQSGSLAAYRALGIAFLALALAAATLGAVLATDYLALVRTVRPEALPIFRSTAFKAGALSALYVALLAPAGIATLRRPCRPRKEPGG